jgi:hypothetical protein
MNADTSKPYEANCPNGAFISVEAALATVTIEQWQHLAKLAEYLLQRLRQDFRMARYLVGIRGEEIVASAVLAIQLGVESPGTGRAVKGRHLQNSDEFFHHLRLIIRSAVDNFRRHAQSHLRHEPIGLEEPGGVFCDPLDPMDLEKELAVRDLLRVLLPRVRRDLKNRPKDLAYFQTWFESLRACLKTQIYSTNKISIFVCTM